MSKFKKIVFGVVALIAITAASVTIFAASDAEKAPGAVIREKPGITYGALASKIAPEEFRNEMLERMKSVLAKKVEEGILTQEQADKIIASIEEMQQNCTGTRPSDNRKGFGAGFGRHHGMGQGYKRGRTGI